MVLRIRAFMSRASSKAMRYRARSISPRYGSNDSTVSSTNSIWLMRPSIKSVAMVRDRAARALLMTCPNWYSPARSKASPVGRNSWRWLDLAALEAGRDKRTGIRKVPQPPLRGYQQGHATSRPFPRRVAAHQRMRVWKRSRRLRRG